jgi:hypothetical protein
MPLSTWNIPFLNSNSQRRYPLINEATGVDSTGSFTIPDDFLVGLSLAIHAGLDVDPSRFFVRQLSVYATGFGVVIGYQPAVGDAVNVATSLIARSSHARNTTYALGGVNDFDDSVGALVVGDLDGIDSQPSGVFTFTLATAQLETDALRPQIRGISSISVVNGTQTSEPMYGDLVLVAGANVQLVPVVVAGQDPVITINAIEGEGLVEECVCEGETAGVAVSRINGIPPTTAGDFTLLGTSCMSIEAIQHGLKFRDTCAEPCCGCSELEDITRDLERFGDQATTIGNFLNRLETSVTQFSTVVLGSRLNDRGCLDCG